MHAMAVRLGRVIVSKFQWYLPTKVSNIGGGVGCAPLLQPPCEPWRLYWRPLLEAVTGGPIQGGPCWRPLRAFGPALVVLARNVCDAFRHSAHRRARARTVRVDREGLRARGQCAHSAGAQAVRPMTHAVASVRTQCSMSAHLGLCAGAGLSFLCARTHKGPGTGRAAADTGAREAARRSTHDEL